MTISQEQMNIKQIALAFNWRLCYESLGLSGYSEKATKAMSIIDCAKSDSKKGWRVAKSINKNPIAYDYAFKLEMEGPEQLNPRDWVMCSGPSELVEVLGSSTKITNEIACEMIQSAAILRAYKKIEQEGLESIAENSGYFQYVSKAITSGALRRIGQGDIDSTVAEGDSMAQEFDPEYNALTAPGKSLTELTVELDLTKTIEFSPLARLTQKIATAHQHIRIANEVIQQRADEEILGY